jgi:hypothetical protein
VIDLPGAFRGAVGPKGPARRLQWFPATGASRPGEGRRSQSARLDRRASSQWDPGTGTDKDSSTHHGGASAVESHHPSLFSFAVTSSAALGDQQGPSGHPPEKATRGRGSSRRVRTALERGSGLEPVRLEATRRFVTRSLGPSPPRNAAGKAAPELAGRLSGFLGIVNPHGPLRRAEDAAGEARHEGAAIDTPSHRPIDSRSAQLLQGVPAAIGPLGTVPEESPRSGLSDQCSGPVFGTSVLNPFSGPALWTSTLDQTVGTDSWNPPPDALESESPQTL